MPFIFYFLLVICLTFIIGSFLGYAVHMILHDKRLGFLAKIHDNHHTEQYPADDFLSDQYRSSGKNSSILVFGPVLTLIVLSVFFLLHLLGVPIWVFVVISIESLFIGFINDYIHDMLHIRNHYLEHFKCFQKLRAFHVIHHSDITKNFSIFFFLWDRVFKTFKEKL